jgi:hypothetical protein
VDSVLLHHEVQNVGCNKINAMTLEKALKNEEWLIKKYKNQLPDIIIATTAINQEVSARSVGDIQIITGLKIENLAVKRFRKIGCSISLIVFHEFN